MAMFLALVLLLLWPSTVWSQLPTSGALLWLRADTLTSYSVAPGTTDQLVSWSSIVGGYSCPVSTGGLILKRQINGKAAHLFNGSSFLTGPSIFPIGRDYTLYLVFEWNGIHSANNIISGISRALFTSQPGQPTLLHSGNFDNMIMAEAPLSGPTVIRVTYTENTRLATLAYNGKVMASGEVPQNVDSIIYIGAYQRGYCLNGTLGEVLLFDRNLNESEQARTESYLHQRYSITQYKEPPPRPVSVLQAPKHMAVLEPNQSFDIIYRVNTSNVRSVVVRTESYGLPRQVTTYDVSVGTVKTIPWQSTPVGFDSSSIVVMADTGGPVLDTVYRAANIVSGTAFTITGQSNSIFGDATLLPSAYARTFGKNNSASASDTLFYGSKADGNGGGAHVGAWGMHLQNAIADQLGSPSLCINGGVGGTRIEQHLPDPKNRLNRSTIYGSWLYRIMKSGRQNDIRWLFWYQGESNHDTEDYVQLFGQLYSAWKQDLPNLQYVVVVQIRPGCAGPRHAKLRDEQRRLEFEFPNIIVHAANALPAHDGCHFGGQGYGTLGSQLFDIYRINELSMQPGVYRTAPMIREAVAISATEIAVTFDRANGLRMTSDMIVNGAVRTSLDGWWANGDAKQHPTSVKVDGNIARLSFSTPVQRVSYVPDYTYDDGKTVFQGPWLVNSDGIGALSFHDISVTTTDIDDAAELSTDINCRIINRATLPSLSLFSQADALYDISGARYDVSYDVVQSLRSGYYTIVMQGKPISIVVVP